MTWQSPKTNWTPVDGIMSPDFNRIESNILETNTLLQPTGSTTALILTLGPLHDNYSRTFIATNNNGAQPTTINGLPLYRANTAEPPTLRTNRAYTIWYSQSNNCFFLQAASEGTALAWQVLQDIPFSTEIENNIIGSMPRKLGVISAQGVGQWPDGALAVYPSEGYYKGGSGDGEIKVTPSQLQIAEPQLQPNNIPFDINLFGIQGTAGVPGIQQYTTPGTYQFVVPAGIRRLFVLCAAGGGGGGGGGYISSGYFAGSYYSAGGGGGGCGIAPLDVTPGQIIQIVVGAGGAVGADAWGDSGNSGAALAGSVGGDSSVGSIIGSGGKGGGAARTDNEFYCVIGYGGAGSGYGASGTAGAWKNDGGTFGYNHGIFGGAGGAGNLNAGQGGSGASGRGSAGQDGKVIILW
jgi:hypothetical protein